MSRARLQLVDDPEQPLPPPQDEYYSWQLQAVCRDRDPSLFFDETRATEARVVCEGCAVRRECLSYAIKSDENHGIWGGLDPAERRRQKWFRAPVDNSWERSNG